MGWCATAERPGSDPGRVLALLGLGTAISLLGDSTLYIVLPRPQIAAEAGITLAAVGLLLGTNRLVRLAFNGLTGSLSIGAIYRICAGMLGVTAGFAGL